MPEPDDQCRNFSPTTPPTIAIRQSSRAAVAGSPSATGLTEKFDDLGFDLVEMVLADQGTWDRHATAQWLAVRRRLDENPADELAAEMPADLRTPGVGTCCTSASTAAGASSR